MPEVQFSPGSLPSETGSEIERVREKLADRSPGPLEMGLAMSTFADELCNSETTTDL